MTQNLPVLPIKNVVLFPYLHMPLSVGRPASLAALEAAVEGGAKEIVVVCQRSAEVESPEPKDLYTIGTKSVIKKIGRPEDGRVQLIVLGAERVKLANFTSKEP